MSEMSYGYLDNPGIRLDANVRRRQISQLLHVITPAAAMCLVLTASPQVMFDSMATWLSWPWNLLLALAFGVLIWDLRALLLRRRGRVAPLTVPVKSMAHAIDFAEDSLGLSAWPPGPGDYVGSRNAVARQSTTVWHSYAVLPLAALAYAASQPQAGDAQEWLERTVTGLASADSDDAWREAARAVAAVAAPTVNSSFFHAMNMEQRHRDSVARVMREAILGASVAVQR